MTEETPRGDGASARDPKGGAASRVNAPTDKSPERDRLPPPVFPPGSRRSVPIRRATAAGKGERSEADDFPEDAFISPDEPIRDRDPEGVPDDAFISPDEPIVRTHEPEAPDVDEVLVTGIGDPAYARGESRLSGSRRRSHRWEEVDTDDVARMLDDLAAGLRERGSTALLVTSEMTRFESMLRGFLAGYLVGRGD